jgi:hypothetical protein
MAPSAQKAPQKTGPAAPHVHASRHVEMYACQPPHARNFIVNVGGLGFVRQLETAFERASTWIADVYSILRPASMKNQAKPLITVTIAAKSSA